MEYNPGESWDDMNECYHSDGEEPDEEKRFSMFRMGAVFDEEELEGGGKDLKHLKDLIKIYSLNVYYR
jgi:hypothetical protein